MAVKLITTIQRYSGLEADTKPTAGVAVGSTFRETDVGHNFFYDGTSWTHMAPSVDMDAHGAQVIVDHTEHAVHAGQLFSATFAEALSSGSASVMLFETPGSAVVSVHFEGVLETSAAGTLIFTEIPNATVGTIVIAYNNSRRIAGSSEVSVTSNGAVTTTGNILQHGVTGGGASMKIGGQIQGHNEWETDADARYLLQFTSSAATNVAWNLFFIEEVGD